MWLLLAGMFGAAVALWPSTPNTIPVHWGVDGTPNGYGSRFEGLMLLPLTALALYIIMLFLPRIDPRRESYQSFAGAYMMFRAATMVFLAVLYGATLFSIKDRPVNITSVALILVGGLFVVLSRVLGQLRPNWFVGIRTPWTLSSERSWTQTHQAGGKFFLGAGLLFAIAGIVGTPWAFWVAFACMLAGSIALVAYSYVVWKNDPDHHPPGTGIVRG